MQPLFYTSCEAGHLNSELRITHSELYQHLIVRIELAVSYTHLTLPTNREV